MTVSFEPGKFSWFCRLRFLFFICLPFVLYTWVCLVLAYQLSLGLGEFMSLADHTMSNRRYVWNSDVLGKPQMVIAEHSLGHP